MTTDTLRQQVQEQVEKIVSSDGFVRSQRLIRFLRFAVGRALEDEQETLKEYVIGLEVFDKAETFDPRIDPIVRVEAGRLRSKLREYYASDGKDDAILIVFQKRSYVPVFEVRGVTGSDAPVAPAPAGGSGGGGAWAAAATATAQSGGSFSAGGQAVGEEQAVGAGPSIVVLPFADLSPEQDQGYFCDGITEEIINALGRVEGLRVVARTSAFQFKGRAVDIREIGEELRVQAVLEGSVRKGGGRIRISAQLNSAADGCHMWSGSYNHDLENFFEVHEEVAQAIAKALRSKLLGERRHVATQRTAVTPSAYSLYLRGLHHLTQRSAADVKEAVQLFESAIADDPLFAAAYVGTADAYVEMALKGDRRPGDLMLRAKAAAQRAQEIDEASAEACVSLGVVRALYDWDWVTSAIEMQRALSLAPASSSARHWYAITCLLPQGRLDDALAQAQQAHDLDPVSPLANAGLGLVLAFRGSYEEALEHYRLATQFGPEFQRAAMEMATVMAQAERCEQAVETLDRVFESAAQETDTPAGRGLLAYCYGRVGRREEAEEELGKLLAAAGSGYVDPLQVAVAYMGLQDAGNAMEWLMRAAEERCPALVLVGVDPMFAPLRAAPAFRSLMRRLRLE
jgi:TolB-like protein/Flp pilus assembly protein TadD